MKSSLVLFFSLSAVAQAAVQLASPFTAHMVLQRDQPVPVWGTAEAGERVSVSFGGQEKSVVADAVGKWRVDLDALVASSEGREFRVSGSKTAEPIVLNDVLVGEVWLCSGQSNMVHTVSTSVYKWAGVINEAQEIAAASYPLIRMFTGEAAKAYEPQARVGGEWRVCSPETVPAFSAIGYFFARDLQKELKVPVGIVTLAYGASCAEAWVRREALAADPRLKPMLEKFDAEVAAFRALPKVTEQAGEARSQDVNAVAAPKPKAPKDPVQDQHNSTVMFNGMIAPVIPYAMRGVLWYQGESIAGGVAGGVELYPRVQAALVNDWRALWGQGDFPFYIVQLAGQNKPSNRPEVREAQATILSLKNTGMAVATDIGEEKNVHPYNKQAVGDRLARIALARTYGKAVEFSGPEYASMRVEGGAIRLTFTHATGGLVVRDGVLKWFEVAGADGKFVAAEARIDGDAVVVSSASVPEPKAARYAWVNFPDGGHLYNGAGLPAAQFRTDAVRIIFKR